MPGEKWKGSPLANYEAVDPEFGTKINRSLTAWVDSPAREVLANSPNVKAIVDGHL